ncbi:hypothetical protein Misp02_60480 [Microtetraspora sp. NBRC 16547]|nr:hypothetical protein Misp02_60480 [Microtetraspora sp. NBRC 16547]
MPAAATPAARSDASVAQRAACSCSRLSVERADQPGSDAILRALRSKTGEKCRFVRTALHRRIIKFTDKEGEFVKYREELNAYLGTI